MWRWPWSPKAVLPISFRLRDILLPGCRGLVDRHWNDGVRDVDLIIISETELALSIWGVNGQRFNAPFPTNLDPQGMTDRLRTSFAEAVKSFNQTAMG